MPKSSKNSIRALCRRRIAAHHISDSDPSEFENHITRLVKENLDNGRFARLASARAKGHPLTLANYVDRVIIHTQHEQARLRALAENDSTEWNRLRDSLYRHACRMTSRFRKGSDAYTEAFDFAQQTCLVIFAQRYPSDVSFDAWAITILKNQVLARYTRSRDVLNQPYPPDSFDTQDSEDGIANSHDEMIADPQSLVPFEKIENQLMLLEAIAQLQSVAQQQVIIWTYLDQLDDAQIERRLHKRRQDVYNLRWRALARLKKIFTKSR